MTIAQMLRNWQSLNLHTEVNSTIGMQEGDILNLNREQLMKNKDAGGESLGGYKSLSYENLKKDMGQSGVVDLKLTGDFQKSFFVDVNQDTFTIDATDSKTAKLTAKYGDAVFGLTKESRKKYTFWVFWAELKQRIETKTQCKFS